MYRENANHSTLVIVTSGKFTFAIDVTTGITKWAYALNVHPCRIHVATDRVYIAGDRELACVDFASGRSIFHTPTEIAPNVMLMVDGDRVYLGARGCIACYDGSGRKLWTNDLGTGSPVGFAVPGVTQQMDLES